MEPNTIYFMLIPISLLVVAYISLLMALGHFLKTHRVPPFPADTALVFGTSLEWKAKQRWEHAAGLFNQGLIKNVIVSGGVPVPGLDFTEAEWFRQNLILLGVPQEHIYLENKATNAAENVEFTLPMLEQRDFKSVVLVMSDFTGIRAHLTAKKAWQGKSIQIYDHHAPSPGYWNPWTWWLTNRGRALTKYVVIRLFRYRLLPYLWRSE